MRRWFAGTAVALAFAAAAARDANGAPYVGAERCKLCHRDVYLSWAKTAHARAMDAVPVPARGEIDGERRAHCLTCHATDGDEVPAVQCEACHGAGSDYASPEIMIDAEKAAMAGLVRPSIGICERCHENEEPAHRATFEMPPPAEWGRFIHDVKSRE